MAATRRTSARSKPLIPLSCCGVLALACASMPRPPDCSPASDVVQIAAGVYVRPGRVAVVFEGDQIANLGFVVGERCVAVIDTGGSIGEGQALDCAIRKVSELPVCYVINTHVHPDHLLGNAAFARPGVEFVGHAKLPRAIALRGDTYLARASAYAGRTLEASNIVFPERTVSEAVKLDIGGRVLTVRAHGSAHTDHDLSVVDGGSNTAFVGDLVFLEHLPVIDGSISGWIAVLGELSAESVRQVVPGHGPAKVRWPAAAAPTLAYLTELRDSIRSWIADGGSLAAAQDTIEASGKSEWQLLDHYHRRNVGAAFAELEWEE